MPHPVYIILGITLAEALTNGKHYIDELGNVPKTVVRMMNLIRNTKPEDILSRCSFSSDKSPMLKFLRDCLKDLNTRPQIDSLKNSCLYSRYFNEIEEGEKVLSKYVSFILNKTNEMYKTAMDMDKTNELYKTALEGHEKNEIHEAALDIDKTNEIHEALGIDKTNELYVTALEGYKTNEFHEEDLGMDKINELYEPTSDMDKTNGLYITALEGNEKIYNKSNRKINNLQIRGNIQGSLLSEYKNGVINNFSIGSKNIRQVILKYCIYWIVRIDEERGCRFYKLCVGVLYFCNFFHGESIQ